MFSLHIIWARARCQPFQNFLISANAYRHLDMKHVPNFKFDLAQIVCLVDEIQAIWLHTAYTHFNNCCCFVFRIDLSSPSQRQRFVDFVVKLVQLKSLQPWLLHCSLWLAWRMAARVCFFSHEFRLFRSPTLRTNFGRSAKFQKSHRLTWTWSEQSRKGAIVQRNEKKPVFMAERQFT